MDLDADVAPLMRAMDTSQRGVAAAVVPLFAALDEDALAANYGAEAQARVSLSAAYALLVLTQALDQLNGGSATLPPGADTQLELKMNRITDYIRKLQSYAKRKEEEGKDGDGEEPPLKKARGVAVEAEADPLGDEILFGSIARGRGKVAVEAVQQLADRANESH